MFQRWPWLNSNTSTSSTVSSSCSFWVKKIHQNPQGERKSYPCVLTFISLHPLWTHRVQGLLVPHGHVLSPHCYVWMVKARLSLVLQKAAPPLRKGTSACMILQHLRMGLRMWTVIPTASAQPSKSSGTNTCWTRYLTVHTHLCVWTSFHTADVSPKSCL